MTGRLTRSTAFSRRRKFRDRRCSPTAHAICLDAKVRAAAIADGRSDDTRAKAPTVGQLLDVDLRRAERHESGSDKGTG